jgi:hypothetical protein
MGGRSWVSMAAQLYCLTNAVCLNTHPGMSQELGGQNPQTHGASSKLSQTNGEGGQYTVYTYPLGE